MVLAASSTVALHSSGLLTSPWRTCMVPPASATRSAVPLRPSPSMSNPNTWPPSRASRTAVARPTPQPAPVISAALPAKREVTSVGVGIGGNLRVGRFRAMRLGDVVNADAARHGKPLDGVRVLALEQMQALPWGTQLLARLGADVVKVEHPTKGDMGRSSLPAMTDPEGRRVGATFLRNNLNKRAIGVDLKHPDGRDLILRLAPHFDVFAENFKGGAPAPPRPRPRRLGSGPPRPH